MNLARTRVQTTPNAGPCGAPSGAPRRLRPSGLPPSPLHPQPVILALLLLALPIRAADVLDARVSIDPASPYVNQPFTVQFEVTTTPGCELQDLSPQGLPEAPLVDLPPLKPLPVEAVQINGKRGERHRFVATGRGLKPFWRSVRMVVQMTLVERRSTGFFSSWSSAPHVARLQPCDLTVRALPDEGRPDGFAGAVGSFALSGHLDPEVVAPFDIVNLTLDLQGTGYLGNAPLVLPAADPRFRTYPPQEVRRDAAGRLVLRQVLVPQGTNATELAAVRFPYFDPRDGAYHVATAGPFSLRFGERHDDVAATRVLAAPAATAARPGPFVTAGLQPRDGRQALTLYAPWAAAALLFLLTMAFLPGRTRVTLPVALAVFAVTLLAGQRLERRVHRALLRVHEPAALRLAPSDAARVLATVPSDAQVQPLENADGWVRAAWNGRVGWLPSSSLAPADRDR